MMVMMVMVIVIVMVVVVVGDWLCGWLYGEWVVTITMTGDDD